MTCFVSIIFRNFSSENDNVGAPVGNKFKDWGSVFLGYRWLDFDYDSGSGLDRYVYDALQRGPLAGLSFHW